MIDSPSLETILQELWQQLERELTKFILIVVVVLFFTIYEVSIDIMHLLESELDSSLNEK